MSLFSDFPRHTSCVVTLKIHSILSRIILDRHRGLMISLEIMNWLCPIATLKQVERGTASRFKELADFFCQGLRVQVVNPSLLKLLALFIDSHLAVKHGIKGDSLGPGILKERRV